MYAVLYHNTDILPSPNVNIHLSATTSQPLTGEEHLSLCFHAMFCWET